MHKLIAAAGLAGGAALALAHPGHGAALAHGHATDAWGFVLLGAAAGLLFWIRRGK